MPQLFGTTGSDTYYGLTGRVSGYVAGAANSVDLLAGDDLAYIIGSRGPSFVDPALNDTILGGVGNDTIGWTGGNSNNISIDGGEGVDRFEFLWGDFNGVPEEYSFSTTILNTSTARITFTNLDSGSVSVHTISNVETFGFDGTNYTFAELSSRVQSGTLPTSSGSSASTSAADIANLRLSADTYFGLEGNDSIYAYGGNDTVNGNQGNDRIYGQSGNDQLWGGKNDDLIFGGVGDDNINGNNDNDDVYGEAGNDLLRGGRNNDFINGGDGNDTIHGDLGRDVLTGGAGADRFVFSGNTSNEAITSGTAFQGKIIMDRITDFQVGTDKIVLASGLYSTSNILTGSGNSYISATFANAVIQVSGVTNLTASDFIFE